MATLPVCCATACSSSHSQISMYGGLRSFSSYGNVMDRLAIGLSNSFHLRGQSPPTSLHSKFVINDSRSVNVKFVDSPVGVVKVTGYRDDLIDVANVESMKFDLDTSSLSDVKSYAMDIFSQVNESITTSVENGQSSLDRISSFVTSALRGSADGMMSKMTSTVDKTGEDGITAMKEASGRVVMLAVDAFRNIILIVEDSVTQSATFAMYSYGSVKEMLPTEIKDVLNVSEDRAMKLLTPFGTALQQGYVALEGLERSLGLDPSDPIIRFILFLGASTFFWAFYWVLTYGGYAGNLSPELSFKLLKGDKSAVLIDIRPEDVREKEGIPDLRRAARSRYANVSLPEVGGSVRKLFKSGKELDDFLLAAVIRNLKIVQDRSQVIVMDANGNRSKAIARSLRRLGSKKPYLVQGGFGSWVRAGLRIKELKPETALTVFNEEAEAIFEEINPTPGQFVGYGLGVVAAAYALVVWEKTLQYIGVFGLCQTLYRRISSYEDSEDFKQDVRQLLAPTRLGGQAITWAVDKLEINRNRNGLPTSPSSTDVQNRVLQAAAKHESQPDIEDNQDPSPETTASICESVDLSEA